jgi:hypothetical protein
MRRLACLVAALAVTLVASVSSVASAGAPTARLAQARFVALGYDLGDTVLLDSDSLNSDRVLPEERAAVQSLYDALEEWGQYVVEPRGSRAELVIAVRKGRLASVQGIGGGFGTPDRGRSVGARGELSSPYDMLTVYDGGTVLWRRTRPAGSPGSFTSMFADFRKDVDKAAKKP